MNYSYLIFISFEEIFKRDHKIQKWQFLLNFTQAFGIAVWTKSCGWYIFNNYFE